MLYRHEQLLLLIPLTGAARISGNFPLQTTPAAIEGAKILRVIDPHQVLHHELLEEVYRDLVFLHGGRSALFLAPPRFVGLLVVSVFVRVVRWFFFLVFSVNMIFLFSIVSFHDRDVLLEKRCCVGAKETGIF